MKLEIFNKEVNSIWKGASSHSLPKQLRFEVELYKNLLKFFQVGDYFFFIFNVPDFTFDSTSAEIEQLLGYTPAEFSPGLLLDIIHPDDRPYFFIFEKKIAAFLEGLQPQKLMKYKVRHDYRIRKANGDYVRILQQSMVIEHDNDGGIIRTLATHTDISHLKVQGAPLFSIIGFDGEPSYINIDVNKNLKISQNYLTKREKQILALIINGKLSKEIGCLLHISKQTVDRHRKNMLAKNGMTNIGQLVAEAIKQGWL